MAGELVYYNLEQVATLLQTSKRTVRRAIQAGKLRAFKVGRELRFTPEAIKEYEKNQEVKPGEKIGEEGERDEENVPAA